MLKNSKLIKKKHQTPPHRLFLREL